MQAQCDDESLHKWHNQASYCAEFFRATSATGSDRPLMPRSISTFFRHPSFSFLQSPLPRLWVDLRFGTFLREGASSRRVPTVALPYRANLRF
jgi:hypothetical protein